MNNIHHEIIIKKISKKNKKKNAITQVLLHTDLDI